jgi:hypothetical protein
MNALAWTNRCAASWLVVHWALRSAATSPDLLSGLVAAGAHSSAIAYADLNNGEILVFRYPPAPGTTVANQNAPFLLGPRLA